MNIIGVVGQKNCGKTTLSSALIRTLTDQGYRVNSLKHTHHAVDVDRPNTDSYRHREAGAHEVILAGGQRYAIMRELRDTPEPGLDELLSRFSPCDWVVVEGFKSYGHPKIEVHRAESNQPLLYPGDKNIIAVASDHPVDFQGPCFDLNDVPAIVRFILSRGTT